MEAAILILKAGIDMGIWKKGHKIEGSKNDFIHYLLEKVKTARKDAQLRLLSEQAYRDAQAEFGE